MDERQPYSSQSVAAASRMVFQQPARRALESGERAVAGPDSSSAQPPISAGANAASTRRRSALGRRGSGQAPSVVACYLP